MAIGIGFGKYGVEKNLLAVTYEACIEGLLLLWPLRYLLLLALLPTDISLLGPALLPTDT